MRGERGDGIERKKERERQRERGIFNILCPNCFWNTFEFKFPGYSGSCFCIPAISVGIYTLEVIFNG